MSSGVVPVIEMPTVGRLLRADRLAALVIAAALASLFGCATSTSLPPRPSAPGSGDPAASGRPSAGSADTGGPSTATPGASATIGGGYYLDDGPGHHPMPAIETLVDAVPRAEPLHRWANRPYQVFGRDYVPLTGRTAYREQGVASWYGRKFHGRLTSTGEPYDMYAMSAAHPTLPLPSYARVTNLENGRSVVVRVNDRGPFLRGRVIDMSAAAAYRLGYMNAGSARVEVELIDTAGIAEGQLAGRLPEPVAAAADQSPAPAGAGNAAAASPVSSPVSITSASPVSSPVSITSASPVSSPVSITAASPVSSPSVNPVAGSSIRTASANLVSSPSATPVPAATLAVPAGSGPPVPTASGNPVVTAPQPAGAGPVAVAAESAGTGHYVQLGAFQSRGAAADARQRFEAELDGLHAPLRIVEGTVAYRVQAGPYGDRREAAEAARKIRVATGLKPWIVALP